MGTRSVIVIYNTFGDAAPEHVYQCVAMLYRHWDGYPTRAGNTLLTVLRGLEVINGWRNGDCRKLSPHRCNNVGRLVAEVIRRYPIEHDISMIGADPNANVWQEWTYNVYACAGRDIELEVVNRDRIVHARKPVDEYADFADDDNDK